ncbi:ribosome maturation factor RimP [Nocardioidaceae bacterium]|nr:ribosome maturation factor RimP [Nocardioidaceae bacterium]
MTHPQLKRGRTAPGADPRKAGAVPQTPQSGPAATIEQVLLAPLAELGLDLEAVEVSSAGRRSVVRVAVDADGGVDMDAVADASREVGRLMDEHEPLGEQPYTLEVTSRGVDRPLTAPRHWRRNAGRLVKVTFVDGRAPLTGRVVDHDEDSAGGVRLDVPGTGAVEVPYADVAKALVQVELNRKEA